MTNAKRFTDVSLPPLREGAFSLAGFSSPGGAALPPLNGTPVGDAVITAATDMTFPDETVCLTGEHLEEASLLLWSEGALRRIKPLRSDFNKLQAVIPADLRRSVTLLWPLTGKGIGAPFRINEPKIWWSDTEYLTADRPINRFRLFGANLSFEGVVPTAVAVLSDGSFRRLTVTERSPYCLEAELALPLAAGEALTVFLHNGTGGDCGWSRGFRLEARRDGRLPEALLPVLRVEDFGALPDDGLDDTDAIESALAEAAGLGGAVILFGAGEYHLSREVEIPDQYPKGLYIRGCGRGEYDFVSRLLPSEYDRRGLSGRYTALSFLDPSCPPPTLLRISGDHVTLCDMTLYGADGHVGGYTMKYGYTVAVSGHHVTLSGLRMIKCDLRDLDREGKYSLNCSNHLYLHTAARHIDVLNCEFHTKACAIWINFYDGPRYAQPVLFDDGKQVRFVRIIGCDFYGYTTPYTHPTGKRPAGDEGEISRGITAMNCEALTVENCRFCGIDRAHDFVLTRSMYIPITANHMYIAGNRMMNIGSTPGTGFDGNTGEQILLHGGLHLGGIYNVGKSEGDRLTVRTDNIRLTDDNGREISPEDTVTNAGSRVTDGLTRGTRGMAYLCAGKGAGQIRRIDGYELYDDRYVFRLESPWLVEPDETSIVMETAPFRENIIWRNTIMKDEPTLAQGFKSGGVLLFFDSYSNIIAENDFRNLAFGVALNAAFKAPVLWNTVRDNRFSGIREACRDAAQGGDSTRHATCFCESVIGNAGETCGWDDYHVWYTVGNVFRRNRCEDCDTSAEIATNRWNNLRNNHSGNGIDDYFGEEKGNTLTVIEQNDFTDVSQGILIGNPAYWSLLRDNRFTFREKEGYEAVPLCHDQPLTNYKLLCVEEGKTVRDENGTARDTSGKHGKDDE